MSLEFESTNWFDHVENQKEKIIDEIATQLSKDRPDLFGGQSILSTDDPVVESAIRQAVLSRQDLVAPHEVEDIVQSITGQATGYGALQDFFTSEAMDITEIFINPSKDGPRVFYSRQGRSWPTNKPYFRSNEDVLRFCQKICEDVGRPFTEDSSIVDAWLRDGSRIAVIGFKTSPLGVAVTIRKSPTTRPPMPLEKLIEFQMLPQFAADLIVNLLVHGHANIGFFGRTDSGKTTFMRALGLHIDPAERTFIAETSFEMYMPNLNNCINLVEVAYGDKTLVDMSQLCKTMNRNNPDRAILGEIRSREIIAASQIASSTSGGFWTTGHAGDISTLRTRLWGMFLDGNVQLPKEFLDEIIASMFHFIIFLDKETITEDRKRTMMEIVEVVPGQGYRTIIKFDADEFSKSEGRTRRWIYENAVSPERLSMLAFRGAKVLPKYEQVQDKHLY